MNRLRRWLRSVFGRQTQPDEALTTAERQRRLRELAREHPVRIKGSEPTDEAPGGQAPPT